MRVTSEYSICRSTIGSTALARRNRIGRHFAQSDDGAHNRPSPVRRWRRRCPRSVRKDRAVPGDRCRYSRAQPLEAVGKEVLHGRRPRIEAAETPSGLRNAPNLTLRIDALALAAAQGFADQHLVVAHAVEIAGIEQGDAGVERGMDRRRCFHRGLPARRNPTCPCSRGRWRRPLGRCGRACGFSSLILFLEF